MRTSDLISDVFSSYLSFRAEWSRRVGGIGQFGVHAFHDQFEGVLLIDVNGLSVRLRPMPDGIEDRKNVVAGTSVTDRLDPDGRRNIKNTKQHQKKKTQELATSEESTRETTNRL